MNGIEVFPACTIEEIESFEKSIGFYLPEDFKEFYLICNGFSCNEDIFNIVILNEIRKYNQDYGNNWFYFSEYMIYSDMWGLRINEMQQYEIFNGSYPEKKLTNNLVEFLLIYLEGNVFDKGGLYDKQAQLGNNKSN